jgi:hypothetical protein
MEEKKARALVEAGGNEAGLEERGAPEPLGSLVSDAVKIGGITAFAMGSLLIIGGANQLAKGVRPPGPLHEGLLAILLAAGVTWFLVTWLVGLIMVVSKGREALLGTRPELPSNPDQGDRPG